MVGGLQGEAERPRMEENGRESERARKDRTAKRSNG